MNALFSYRVPAAANLPIDGEWTFCPHPLWPSDFPLPNFQRWQSAGQRALVRNLIALFLLESGLSISQTADFLNLSNARTATVARTMRKRLFGKGYRAEEETLERSIENFSQNPNARHLVGYFIEKKQRYPQSKMRAILNSISRLSAGAEDIRLFHHAVEYIRLHGQLMELPQYGEGL